MVASAEIAEFYAKPAPRARGQDHTHTCGATTRSKPNRVLHLHAQNYEPHIRLESCSKDPIGYVGGENLYQYASAMPLLLTDPSGMQTELPQGEIDLLSGCPCVAVKLGTVLPNGQKVEIGPGTLGWVTCDANGGFVPQQPAPTVPPNPDCYSKCGATECTQEHEEYHIEQFKKHCPDACKTPECTEDRAGWVMLLGGDPPCQQKSECLATKRELECLKKKYEEQKRLPRVNQTYCFNRPNPRGPGVDAPCSGYLKALYNKIRSTANGAYDPNDPTKAGQYACRSKDVGIDLGDRL